MKNNKKVTTHVNTSHVDVDVDMVDVLARTQAWHGAVTHTDTHTHTHTHTPAHRAEPHKQFNVLARTETWHGAVTHTQQQQRRTHMCVCKIWILHVYMQWSKSAETPQNRTKRKTCCP